MAGWHHSLPQIRFNPLKNLFLAPCRDNSSRSTKSLKLIFSPTPTPKLLDRNPPSQLRSLRLIRIFHPHPPTDTSIVIFPQCIFSLDPLERKSRRVNRFHRLTQSGSLPSSTIKRISANGLAAFSLYHPRRPGIGLLQSKNSAPSWTATLSSIVSRFGASRPYSAMATRSDLQRLPSRIGKWQAGSMQQ
jgi:hypothetical protein